MQKRLYSFDIMRALCMLWIVGFWHLQEYIDSIAIYNSFTYWITNGVLGTFFWISGYFIGKKSVRTKQDVNEFYKNRIWKIYIPFLIVSVAFYALHILFGINYIETRRQLVLTILGLSCFITPAPSTIWFVSLLTFLYLITPVVLQKESDVYRIHISLLIVLMLIFAYHFFKIDERVILFVPFYFSGIIISKNSMELKYIIYVIIFMLCTMMSMVLIDITMEIPPMLILQTVLFIVFIYVISRILESFKFFSEFALKLSYLSYMAYLIHRIYYGIINKLFGDFSVGGGVFVVLPSFLIIAYIAQKIYDRFISRI